MKKRIISVEDLVDLTDKPSSKFDANMPNIEAPEGTVFVGVEAGDNGEKEYIFIEK
jgi:hypothetical protein